MSPPRALQQVARAGVAKVVETNLRPEPRDRPVPRILDADRSTRLVSPSIMHTVDPMRGVVPLSHVAAGRGKHESLGLRSATRALPHLEERLARSGDERDSADLPVLRRFAIASPHDDFGAIAVEIDVAPAEAPQLAPAKAGVDCRLID